MLEAMVNESRAFCAELKANKRPRWLSLLGNSGTGKTFLAEKIYQQCRSAPHLFQDLAYDQHADVLVYWPEVAEALQNGVRYDMRAIATARFAVIDDIGAVLDKTGFVTNKLSIILGQRVKRWTVLTANMSSQQIGVQLDTRIASRLFRDGSRVLDIDAPDYSTRGI